MTWFWDGLYTGGTLAVLGRLVLLFLALPLVGIALSVVLVIAMGQSIHDYAEGN